ncbi:Stealth CR1 domain-containing protein [bacterium]|nr:Stealth CR1 domain-containing protein [bacterium]
MQDIKIDLVYLWVDGNDKKWQEEKITWAKKLNIQTNFYQNSSCRFIDNDELKYSLRSAEMYAPWINKIFIITNGQVPSWLDINHPKIRIVNHQEIMPLTALPTYNSQAIVSCIDNIKDLSEHYLLGNDDTFFSDYVNPRDFFDDNGNPYIKLRYQNFEPIENLKDTYRQSILYSIKLLKEKFNIKEDFEKYEPLHCIDSYRKSYFSECKNIFKDEYNTTAHARFRANETVQSMLLKLYMLHKKNCKLVINPQFKEQDSLSKVENLYISLQPIEYMRRIIKGKEPKLLCINDCSVADDKIRSELKIFLNELFPKVQDWEKVDNFQIKPAFKENYQTVVFSFNNDYCKYFSVALQSLIKHADYRQNYDLIILTSGIDKVNKDLILKKLPSNFSIRFFNMTDIIVKNFPGISLSNKKYWSIEIYYRIFIPFIMQNYKKVLYLDTDVIVNENLNELFDIDFDNNELLAVKDTTSQVLSYEIYKERKEHIENTLKLNEPKNYFNSGMLLFNISSINLNNYYERLREAIKIKNLLYPDQDILNMIFENKTKLISSSWNYCCGELLFNNDFIEQITEEYKDDFLNAQNYPKIIHYTSPRKPWNYKLELHFDKFWEYARNTVFYEDILLQMNKDISQQVLIENAKYLNLYQKINNNNKILFWGASIFLENFIKKYEISNDNILGIVDKNPNKYGSFVEQYQIISPNDIKKINPDEIIVTIVNSNAERVSEIKNDLDKLNLDIKISSI